MHVSKVLKVSGPQLELQGAMNHPSQFYEPNSNPLQEQNIFLTTEPSLRCILIIFLVYSLVALNIFSYHCHSLPISFETNSGPIKTFFCSPFSSMLGSCHFCCLSLSLTFLGTSNQWNHTVLVLFYLRFISYECLSACIHVCHKCTWYCRCQKGHWIP